MTDLSHYSADDLISRLWHLCDKPERLRALDLIDSAHQLDEETFWSNFWHIWTAHESIFLDHDVVEQMIGRHDRTQSTSSLDEEEISALAALPDKVEVYRGCRSHNVHGWSWTLNREKAEWFAGRSAGKGAPILLHAIVPKDRILAFLDGRNEQEIVALPSDVLIHHLKTLPRLNKATERRNEIYQMVQSRETSALMTNMRAQMTVANYIANGGDLAELIVSMQGDCDIASVIAPSRYAMLSEVLRLSSQHLAGGDELQDMLDGMRQARLANPTFSI